MLPFARPGESLVAIGALLVIVLICRWVFAPAHPHRRAAQPDDYGLLVPVVRAPSGADARMLRDLLVDRGVRASVTARHEVLVFADDLERARTLVGQD